MEPASPADPNIEIRSEAEGFIRLIFERLEIDGAVASGQMEVSGDRRLIQQFGQWFAGA